MLLYYIDSGFKTGWAHHCLVPLSLCNGNSFCFQVKHTKTL